MNELPEISWDDDAQAFCRTCNRPFPVRGRESPRWQMVPITCPRCILAARETGFTIPQIAQIHRILRLVKNMNIVD